MSRNGWKSNVRMLCGPLGIDGGLPIVDDKERMRK